MKYDRYIYKRAVLRHVWHLNNDIMYFSIPRVSCK